jgi:hypothetical protein
MKVETRVNEIPNVELRASMEGDQMVIEGRAITYDVESRPLSFNGKKFTETILRGAAKDANKKSAYLTYNHNKDEVLASVKSGSLTLNEDDKGVGFRAVLNNTTYSKNLYEMVLRGDVNENSFGFTVEDNGQKWSRSVAGVPQRHISRISNLVDISVVGGAFEGAYPQTEVYARGLEEFEKEQEPTKIDNTIEKEQKHFLDLMLKK